MMTAERFTGNIFSPHNRGILLDVFIFLVNLTLMRYLTGFFLKIAQAAFAGDFIAGLAIFLFALAIFFLPSMGAILKRWHFHRRLQAEGKKSNSDTAAGGCLFNPIFYFCLNIVIYCGLNAFAINYFYGDQEPSGQVFVSSILFGIVLVIFQTFIVYRYFTPPKKDPRTEFMRGSNSEKLGDICIFLNMILNQILWNLITTSPLNHETGIAFVKQIIFRFIFLFFVSLFVYFPPRIFYLAEDIDRPRARLTILLANLPVILRVIFGGLW